MLLQLPRYNSWVVDNICLTSITLFQFATCFTVSHTVHISIFVIIIFTIGKGLRWIANLDNLKKYILWVYLLIILWLQYSYQKSYFPYKLILLYLHFFMLSLNRTLFSIKKFKRTKKTESFTFSCFTQISFSIDYKILKQVIIIQITKKYMHLIQVNKKFLLNS